MKFKFIVWINKWFEKAITTILLRLLQDAIDENTRMRTGLTKLLNDIPYCVTVCVDGFAPTETVTDRIEDILYNRGSNEKIDRYEGDVS